MAKTKAQKEEIVSKLENALKASETSVFVSFTQMKVADETKMRRAMRAEGLGYTVAKKSLIRRALRGMGHDESGLELQGELAVAYNAGSGDPTAPARRVHAFAGEFAGGKLAIAGGIFDGKLVGAEQMQEIATIPSMLALRGKLANLIASPMQRLAMVLDQHAQKEA